MEIFQFKYIDDVILRQPEVLLSTTTFEIWSDSVKNWQSYDGVPMSHKRLHSPFILFIYFFARACKSKYIYPEETENYAFFLCDSSEEIQKFGIFSSAKQMHLSSRSFNIINVYWTKKERYHFGDVTFLSSRWKWIYGIWNIVNSHIPHRVMS